MPSDEGYYGGNVIEIGTGRSQNERQTPYLYIKGNITHVWDGAQYDKLVTPLVRDVRYFVSDGAMPMTMPRLEAIGFNGDFANPDIAPGIKEKTRFVCQHEDYNGKTIERWLLQDAEEAAPGASHEAPDQQTILRLNQLYKAQKSQSKPTNNDDNGGSNAPSAAQATPPAADEIPF